jgi:hypothetical protein
MRIRPNNSSQLQHVDLELLPGYTVPVIYQPQGISRSGK